MSIPADRRHLVAEMQAMSRELRATISTWKPDMGFARKGPDYPKPETQPDEWAAAGLKLMEVAERAATLARFACDSARAARETMMEEDPR